MCPARKIGFAVVEVAVEGSTSLSRARGVHIKLLLPLLMTVLLYSRDSEVADSLKDAYVSIGKNSPQPCS